MREIAGGSGFGLLSDATASGIREDRGDFPLGDSSDEARLDEGGETVGGVGGFEDSSGFSSSYIVSSAVASAA